MIIFDLELLSEKRAEHHSHVVTFSLSLVLSFSLHVLRYNISLSIWQLVRNGCLQCVSLAAAPIIIVRCASHRTLHNDFAFFFLSLYTKSARTNDSFAIFFCLFTKSRFARAFPARQGETFFSEWSRAYRAARTRLYHLPQATVIEPTPMM